MELFAPTMRDLEDCFHIAKENEFRYIGVLVAMPDFPKYEVIINEFENFDMKLEYYKKTYDDNLNHKFAPGIKIVAYTYADTFDDIQETLR